MEETKIAMDYEKKYKEVLGHARQAYGTGAYDDQTLEAIFPELKESEDERIINQLITLVNSTGEVLLIPTNKEELIAWLEKQKENPKSADSIPSDCVSDAKCEDKSPKHSDSDGTDIRDTPAYWKGWDDAMKQKEQNHPKGCFTCDEYKKGYEIGRLNGFTAGYNKAMKEVDQKEQKPWKVGANAYFTPEQKPVDYDHEMWKNCEANFEGGKKEVIEHPEKYGLQKPAEWSEENEEIIDTIVSILGQYIDYKAVSGTGSGYATPRYSKEIAWLKSLRPSWKPTKAQIKALDAGLRRLRKETISLWPVLTSLYNDLTKQMEQS